MTRRRTELEVQQRPSSLFVRVRAHSLDGDVSVTWRWTWLGWPLQWFLPKPAVKVVRKRDLVLRSK